MGFTVVIPARLASTRLPRKVLRPIGGRPLLEHVWRAACASGAERVIVATDAEEVVQVARGFGAEVALTSPAHRSGTDRLAEVARRGGWPPQRIVVNLQGDEPLMPPPAILEVAELLQQDSEADIATLAQPLAAVDWRNPNAVKVVLDAAGRALYFSRAPIPWPRAGQGEQPPAGLALRHIGMYAFRVAALLRFAALPPAALEVCEALEQLRALTHGLRVRVGVTCSPPGRGVDTEEDLREVARLLETGT
ncbi:MAG: 3-deoxy-manno-octulosonate cytidylyltransferase [Gammaproteobacteria bacterium]|nr:3-deoxy-manno-octulosonate cytidylyltransferase [Gammaproteobacteria bacterium]